jgi:uncharacterized protein
MIGFEKDQNRLCVNAIPHRQPMHVLAVLREAGLRVGRGTSFYIVCGSNNNNLVLSNSGSVQLVPPSKKSFSSGTGSIKPLRTSLDHHLTCAVEASLLSPPAMSTSMISLTELLIPTYKQMLKHLSGWLDKAGDKANELLAHHLAPDMHPLDTQIRYVCHQSKEAVCRLQGTELAPLVQSAADESPTTTSVAGTVEEAKARILEALTFLEDLEPDALDADPSIAERTITLDLPGGIKFEMTTVQFARDWALPQFYFHMVVAYSILRNAGVDLGKADYVPHMFAYLRPGTMCPHQQPVAARKRPHTRASIYIAMLNHFVHTLNVILNQTILLTVVFTWLFCTLDLCGDCG